MAVFEDVARTYSAPGDHGESYWRFLNRSSRPEAGTARKLIETWFSHLCPALGQGVQQRLQSGDNQDFAAGFWELYLHELFRRLGYEITCEAATPSGRNIDFLVRRGETAFYLEATTAGKSAAKRGADARRDRIYNEVNKLQAHNFILSIRIEAAGANDLKNARGLRCELRAWLEPLDPDEALEQWDAIGEGPTFKWEDGAGWLLAFRAFPKRPSERGQPGSRPLHFLMDEVSIVDDEHPLQGALERKRPSRYGALSLPYVVAISEEPFDPEPAWQRRNLLFGRETVGLRDGQPARSARRTDGTWRGPGAVPQHTRLAAVLFCARTVALDSRQDRVGVVGQPICQPAGAQRTHSRRCAAMPAPRRRQWHRRIRSGGGSPHAELDTPHVGRVICPAPLSIPPTAYAGYTANHRLDEPPRPAR